MEAMIQKNDTPFFSIIIPIYNVISEYFSECMNSILNQTCRDFEVILVDDGSTAECAEKCDSYSEQDGRVRVVHKRNQGVSAARNTGIEMAAADWIMFVDADDWLELNALDILKQHLYNASFDILLFNAVKEFAAKKQPLHHGLENGAIYNNTDVGNREMFYSRAMGSPNAKADRHCVIYYSWDKVYHREFILNSQVRYPVGVRRSEDKIFILSCFEKMHSLFYIDKTLYHYRINEASVSNKYSEFVDEDRIDLVKRLSTIAARMDQELGRLRGESPYDTIEKQFERFTFGIISDVLELKFYHPDYPRSRKERMREVREFLHTEPFKSAIRAVEYRNLPRNAQLKKFMLSHGLVSQFYGLRKWKSSLSGRKAE